MRGCKQRAKKQGIPFDIDAEYLLSIYQPICPYLNIPLTIGEKSGDSLSNISIDRVIPELGYVKGNVQIISFKANVMKQDVDIELLKTFARNVLERHNNDNN